jgi:hypothetical protein
MRNTEGSAGGLGVRMVVPVAEICMACFTGFKANADVGSAQKFSSVGRTSAG